MSSTFEFFLFFVAENGFCLDGRRLIEIKKRRQRLLPLNLLPIEIHRFSSTFTKRGTAHYCAYQSSLLIFGHLLHFIRPPSVLLLASAKLTSLKGSSRFTFQKKAALSLKKCAEI
jgi:hypothetical protein